MSYVTLNNLEKKYGKKDELTVKGISLQIEQGEFVALVGPSGCGKSTTLRMIAGLEDITGGDIAIDGTVVNDIHAKNRNIAMVFQNYALYPHMSVFDNMAFGLEIQKVPKEEIEQKIKWVAEILGLEELLDRLPRDLSGGQRQRVALGRAIVRNPKVFLMDEPLSNLDAKLRGKMRSEITKIHRELDATTIYVTHDQIEAMTMADRIVVMNDGIIQQIGSPMELYDNPINLFVASFIGSPQMNFMTVDIKSGVVYFSSGQSIKLTDGVIKQLGEYEGEVILGARPEAFKLDNMSIDALREQEIQNNVVESLENMGHEMYIHSNFSDQVVVIRIGHNRTMEIGKEFNFAIDVNKCHFFDPQTRESILYNNNYKYNKIK